MPRVSSSTSYRALITLPLTALLAISPLLIGGPSCGHDFLFHIQSWLDAAAQLRHGTPLPHWTFSAAWNAGEPRFLFYPPLSWMLGEVLLLVSPTAAVTTVYTAVVLLAAGLSFYAFARSFTARDPALLASAVYLANPYLLFTAFERTAYAELLAAVWFPLLLRGLLRRRVSIPGIAVPLALLWLTNVPAAIMGCYTLLIVGVARLLMAVADRRTGEAEPPPLRLTLTALGGLLLACGLAAFYLLPAAVEQRYVQVALANGPGLSPLQSFLFGHTADPAHDRVLHTASATLVVLLAVGAASFSFLLLRDRDRGHRPLLLACLSLLAVIAVLQFPLSAAVWLHAPELALLQFPWRFASVVSPVACLGIALLLARLPLNGHTHALAVPAALFAALLLGWVGIRPYRQPCDDTDYPAARAHFFANHFGVAATDEYTAVDADNDSQRPDEPPFWLTTDSDAYAPGTTANPHEADPDEDDVDVDIPATAHLNTTPLDFSVSAPRPEFLVLNLRDFHDWQVSRNGVPVTRLDARTDGLIAFPVPAGTSHITVRWHRSWDQQLGLGLSLACLAGLPFGLAHSRRRAALRAAGPPGSRARQVSF